MLAEVYGVIEETLKEINMDYYVIPPVVWKATVKIAGKGREAEKKLAQKYIVETYGCTCTEDEADAACLGTHIIKKENSEFDWS